MMETLKDIGHFFIHGGWPSKHPVQGDLALKGWNRRGWDDVRDKLWLYYQNKQEQGLDVTLDPLNKRMKQGEGFVKNSANCLSFVMQLPVSGFTTIEPHVVSQLDFKNPQPQTVRRYDDERQTVMQVVSSVDNLCSVLEKSGLFHRQPCPETEPVLTLVNDRDYHFIRLGQMNPVTQRFDAIEKGGYEEPVTYWPTMQSFLDKRVTELKWDKFHEVTVMFYEGLRFDWKMRTEDQSRPHQKCTAYHLSL